MKLSKSLETRSSISLFSNNFEVEAPREIGVSKNSQAILVRGKIYIVSVTIYSELCQSLKP